VVPKRASNAGKRRQFTQIEERNLQRFGCTFRDRAGAIHIDWRGRDLARAADAEIFARLVFIKNDLGPVVFVACEFSPVRPLPHYCYFPFDLGKPGHRDYLCRFADAGEIKLRFVSSTKTLDRVHHLTSYLRARTAETYAQAMTGWDNWEGKRDPDAVLQLFERHARVPLFLERVIFDDSLAEARVNARRAADGVPNENRALAASIVRDAATAFEPYYQRNGQALFDTFNVTRVGLSSIIDLRRMLADSPVGLTEFISDALAGSLPRSELEKIGRLLAFVLSLFRLPFRQLVGDQSTPGADKSFAIPDIPEPLVSMFQSMGTLGISKNSLSTLFELFGLQVGGQPGRPSKDYFREHELKLSGSSWTNVARSALAERLELQEEFGTRDYRTLDRGRQELLKNRIRQGVSAYVKRTAKPVPSESDGADSPSPVREQEIP
jgi:hypothetical protein